MYLNNQLKLSRTSQQRIVTIRIKTLNQNGVSPPNGFVLKLNGENYTTYNDLLRLHQFFMVGSVEAADPLVPK